LNKKIVWIAWETQRRSVVLSDALNCKLYIYEKKHRNMILRYIFASISTILFILREKPRLVFCQNPSMVLTLIMCIMKKPLKIKLIVDRHSNFLIGREVNSLYRKIFNIISSYTIKKSDMTIVTNEYLLENYIHSIGAKGYVLQDKIPCIKKDIVKKNTNKSEIFYINSFSSDEPIDEFFLAINDIDDRFYFYVSGNYNKYIKAIDKKGKNYELTGFVDDCEFIDILNSVDAVMVFTNNKHTITCGAYEGVSAEKPLIISDTKELKEYFNIGAIYCDNTSNGIRESIIKCFDNYEKLKEEVIRLKYIRGKEWECRFGLLNENIHELLMGE